MEFQEILNKRRAINFFDPDREVDEATLKTLLESAGNAPSSFNLQPWKVIIFRDKDKRAALQKLAFNQPKITQCSAVLVILADRAGWQEGNKTFETLFSKTMQAKQREWFVSTASNMYGSTEEVSQAFANKNAALFAMSLMYAASDMGLHTHPMDGFDHEGIRQEFDIAANYWIPMLIAVGYAASDLKLTPKAWRQSYDEIVLKTY